MSHLVRKGGQEPVDPKIWTLKQLMTACRERVPVILRTIDEMLDDPSLTPNDRIKLMDLVRDRGFGKPNQTVRLSEERMNASGQSAVRVYIPDNYRHGSARTIDSETLEDVPEKVPTEQLDLDLEGDDPLDDVESAEVIILSERNKQNGNL